MEVKIQHYTFEENEFDIFSDPSIDQVLSLFNNFDILDENQKRLVDDVIPTFIIQTNNHLVRIIPASDDLIDFIIFQPDIKKEYRKREFKKDTLISIKKFLTSGNDFIKECLELNLSNKKEHIEKSVTKNFDYTFGFQKIIWRLGIAVFIFALIYFLANKEALILYFIWATIILPFLLIYSQYVVSNYGYTISLSRGRETFTITKNGVQTLYRKSDIETIDYYHSHIEKPGTRPNLFDDTAYMQIKFHDGSKIILNTLTVNRDHLDIKFRDQKINMHVVFIPYIR